MCSFVIALAQPAAAQAPSATDLSIAAFLEKRVPEELASEGVVLSRANLTLKVEMLGDKLLLSLVDLSTGRVAASTKVDQIPPDRDAAVASVTHVAAALASQVVHHPDAPPSATPPIDERAERKERELAEARFHKQAIRFGQTWNIVVNKNGASVYRGWLAYQGESDQVLEPVEFYTAVGRPDLADSYQHRRWTALGGILVSTAGVIAESVLIYKWASVPRPDCSVNLPFDQFSMCLDASEAKQAQDRSQYVTPMIVAGAVSLVGLVVGTWYAYRVHPVSENEAKSLADQYNQGLRRNLGLPVVRRAPRLHDLKLLPYVGGQDAGLALGARF